MKTTEQCIVKIDEKILFRDDFPSQSTLSDFHFPDRERMQNETTSNDKPLVQNGGGRSEENDETGGGVKAPKPVVLKRKQNDKVIHRSQILTWSKTKQSKRHENIIKLNRTNFVHHPEKVGEKTNETINDDLYGQYNKDLYLSEVIPLLYKRAIKDPKWQEAIMGEINAWNKRKVFDVVPKLTERKAVPVKWLFTIKGAGQYKARILAVGNLDAEAYSKEEKKSPTPGQLIVKWFLALAISQCSKLILTRRF
jgi:hypothetical protein